jgi:flagellar protein FlbD
MIKLTHLDGEPFLLNAEQIRYVDARPDTFITMSAGERVVVRETLDDVLRLCVEYQRSKQWLSPASGLAQVSGLAPTDGGARRRSGVAAEAI